MCFSKIRLLKKGKKASSISQKHSLSPKTNELTDISEGINSKKEIFSTLHPFEEKGIGGTLSPVQKAITCAIQLHNGWANEEQILTFLINNWESITSNTTHKYRQCNKRILHINFAVSRGKQALFIQHPTIPETWGLPSLENEEEPIISEHEIDVEPPKPQRVVEVTTLQFEEALISILEKSSSGFTMNELIIQMDEYKNLAGLFPSLAFDRRVRAVLIVLKNQNKIIYNPDQETWSINPLKDQKKLYLPLSRSKQFKDDESIRSLTITELWDRLYSH